MACPTRQRISLLALLAVSLLFCAVAAPARAVEVAALDLDQGQTSVANIASDRQWATLFTAQASGPLSRVSVPINAPSWGTEPVTVELVDVTPDNKPGAVLASGTIPRSAIATADEWGWWGHRTDVVLSPARSLVWGARYGIVLRTGSPFYYFMAGSPGGQVDGLIGEAFTCCGFDWRGPHTGVAFKVWVEHPDESAPFITIASPVDGATVQPGAELFAAFSCVDDPDGSGVAGCTATLDGAPIGNGARLPTAAYGGHTLVVTATDNAGNVATASSRYGVAWPFGGFYAPVNAAPTVNVVQAGAAVPLKFSLGGDRGLGVLDGAPAVRTVSCDSGAESDVLEETAAESRSGLSYDAGADRYLYVWKTAKEWAGTCRRFDLRLADGSVHSAVFRMR